MLKKNYWVLFELNRKKTFIILVVSRDQNTNHTTVCTLKACNCTMATNNAALDPIFACIPNMGHGPSGFRSTLVLNL